MSLFWSLLYMLPTYTFSCKNIFTFSGIFILNERNYLRKWRSIVEGNWDLVPIVYWKFVELSVIKESNNQMKSFFSRFLSMTTTISEIIVRNYRVQLQHKVEAQLRNTIWFVSWAHECRNILETMTGDKIDTFRKSTQAVNQEFNWKTQIEKSTGHRVSCSRSWYVNQKCSRSFQVAPLSAQC